jgi:thiamine-monophosphate kinase
MGHCPCGKKILRSGAAIGDLIYVSGTLGDAAFGLSLLGGEHRGLDLDFEDQDHLVSRFTAPDAHLDLGVRLRGEASSCIDISDGLLQDAAHIANASGCKFIIESGLVPLSPALQRAVGEPRARDLALRGGEDYQLLFTLRPTGNPPSGSVRIGRVENGEGVECDVMPKERGYDHFH